MNPSSYIRIGVTVILIVLAAALAMVSKIYLDERDAFTAYRSETEALGRAAFDRARETKKLHEQTLINVRKNYEARVPKIRNDAVAAYRASIRVRVQAKPSSSRVPAAPVSVPVDDGAQQQCVLDEGFIRDAAEDAAKVGAWQQWCYENHCPVASD